MRLLATYELVLFAGLLLAGLTALASAFVTTPYGRFEDRRLGPTVPTRLGWVLMELPALLFYPLYFVREGAAEPAALLFVALWTLHYANRLVAFPLLMRTRPGSRMSVSVFASGWVVVPMHAYLYACWLGEYGDLDQPGWLARPSLYAGLMIYLMGFGLLLHSEHTLRTLRDARVVSDEGGYRVPYGGGFRWVSSPHYLGELVAWLGLLVATGCPGGLFILAISLANLVPRSLATHRWYKETFPDYPPERRALVPLLF